MTEINPRDRQTSATATSRHNIDGGEMLAVRPVSGSDSAEIVNLLSEIGVPSHFLADIDPAALDLESWDHIPDLDEELEKGAREASFNFDWSWLQQDLQNPGLQPPPNPVIAKGDWRSPPAPKMVRQAQEPASIAAKIPDVPTAPSSPISSNTALTAPVIANIVPVASKAIPAPSPLNADYTAATQAVELPLDRPTSAPDTDVQDGLLPGSVFVTTADGQLQLADNYTADKDDTIPAQAEWLDATPTMPARIDRVPVLNVIDQIHGHSEWSAPVSIAAPVKNTKIRAAERAEQLRLKSLARIEKQQQSRAHAAELRQQQAQLRAQRQQEYRAKVRSWLDSRLVQHQIPMAARLVTGVSAIALFSAATIWGGAAIKWQTLAHETSQAMPRFDLAHTVTVDTPTETQISAPIHDVTADTAVQAMSFEKPAVTRRPPAPVMKPTPVPPPLAIETPAQPPQTEKTEIARLAPDTAASQPAHQVQPDAIPGNLPVVNAPEDTRPLPVEIQELRHNAIAGNRQAQHDLGAFYAGGRQIERDFVRATYWFREAAIRGVPNAQYNLGVLLQRGLGVPQDTVMATQWYVRAAQNNHPEAQYNLGVAYADGIGVEKNIPAAAQWFEKAAVAGLARAAFNLGVIYELGLSGQSDIDRAVRWYARAAEAGERDAHESLDRLNIAAADIPGLAAELTKDLAQKYPATTVDTANDQPLNSDQIAEVQTLLSQLGIYRGSADGSLGPKTVRAINNFQQKTGMAPSGKATESLLAALRRQTGNDSPIN